MIRYSSTDTLCSHRTRDYKLLLINGFLVGFPLVTQPTQLVLIGIATAKLSNIYNILDIIVNSLQVDAANWHPNSGSPPFQLAGIVPMAEQLTSALKSFHAISVAWSCIMLSALVVGIISGIQETFFRVNNLKAQVHELEEASTSISDSNSSTSSRPSTLQRIKRALLVDWTNRELIKPSRIGLDHAVYRKDLLASICDNIMLGSVFYRIADCILAAPMLYGFIQNLRGQTTLASYVRLQIVALSLSTAILYSLDWIFWVRSRMNSSLSKPPSFGTNTETFEVRHSSRFVLTIGQITTFKVEDPTQSMSESSQA